MFPYFVAVFIKAANLLCKIKEDEMREIHHKGSSLIDLFYLLKLCCEFGNEEILSFSLNTSGS